MTDLSDLEWRIVAEEARDGATNMALDEVAAETAASEGLATVRVYQWSPSTLSLGYNQDPATVDWAFCEREGVAVTRRPTGGGAIYHDEFGDISYSIVVPADAVPGDLMDCYELLCEPILDAFAAVGVDAAFVDAERPAVYPPACYLRALHPAHDVVGPDGRKVAGNAQYRQRDAVVQHGSLTFSTTPERHCACFTGAGAPADADGNRAGASNASDEDAASDGGDGSDPVPHPDAFADRVAGIDEYAAVDRADAVRTLTATLARWAGLARDGRDGGVGENDVAPEDWPGRWRGDELDAASRRAERVFASDAWVRDAEKPD